MEAFHEDKTGGVASVMAEWRERRAQYDSILRLGQKGFHGNERHKYLLLL